MKQLPPIELLRSLLHYDENAGTITYRQQRGPRRAGDLAGSSTDGIPHVELDGQRYRCGRVAWALYYGWDPSYRVPILHVWPRDGDIHNLKLENLELQPKPFRQKYLTSKKKRYPKSDIYFSRRYGLWIAKYKGRYIKRDCLTKEEAIDHRNNAILIAKRKNAADC